MKARGKHRASRRHLLLQNELSHGVRHVNSLVRLKDVTHTSKRMRHSPTIGRNSSVQWRKLEEAEDFECVFVVYCVLESK